MNDKYRIINYTAGKYGYRHYYELQEWNPVYKRYYVLYASLEGQFITGYCVMQGIDYKDIPLLDQNGRKIGTGNDL